MLPQTAEFNGYDTSTLHERGNECGERLHLALSTLQPYCQACKVQHVCECNIVSCGDMHMAKFIPLFDQRP